MSANKVYIIGAGPGDPGLITVKGREILRQADAIIYDYLVDKRLLDQAREDAESICCDRLGKKKFRDGFLRDQEKISRLIVRKAREGKKVVRLRNGDSSIFSRVSQELDTLVKNKIEFEIVPGVTAASAASALSGIPLTDRKLASSCVFVTGHEDPGKKESSVDWNKIAGSGTIVLYMAVENISKIAKELIKSGKSADTPVAAVSNAGRIDQKTAKAALKSIAKAVRKEKITAPAIFIIGEVVKLEKEFNWLRRSRKVLFTGLSEERFFTRGVYFHLPLIKIEPLEDYSAIDNNLRNITGFDWIVFTSRYGVEYFFKRFKARGYDARALSGIKIAAIGNSTKAKLEDFGILPDLMPKEESSAGLLNEFKKIDIKDKKIFLPRSDISDKGLRDGLQDLGVRVTAAVVYKNVGQKDLPDLNLSYFDEVMFTSPSGVRNFVKRYGKVPRRVKVSCIGSVTRKEAKRYGIC